MDKFEINIDKHQIRKKPPKGDKIFGRISNRVAKNKEVLSAERIGFLKLYRMIIRNGEEIGSLILSTIICLADVAGAARIQRNVTAQLFIQNLVQKLESFPISIHICHWIIARNS